MKRVLVVSPHPDDEAIGCGGVLCWHAANNEEVRVVFLTSGEKGGHGRGEVETAGLREAEARAAAAILGYERLDFWRLPDGALRATHTAVERLRALLHDWPPDMLYVPHPHEQHPDHRAAFRIVRRTIDGQAGHMEVRGYEVWTPLHRIDLIYDISPHVETKRAAIRAYKTQCDVLRFDEASLGLNRYRGEMHSWPGGDYAEVFSVLHP